MRLEHDRKADAIYITLRKGTYAYGEDLDHERRIDYGADGRPLGIELLNVSEGVDLEDLPERAELARLLEAEKVPVFAA